MNQSVTATRLRLTTLWMAVFSRAVGENAVRAYAILRQSDGLREHTVGFLFLWLGLAAVPAFALAPLIGAIASSRGRWLVMVLATLAGLGVIAWSSFEEHREGQTFWLGCIAVLAFESAFFSACRFAILPETFKQARVSLSQLIGLFAVATGVGMLVGLWIGVEHFLDGKPGMPVPLQFGHIGYGLALVCILLARFPTEKPVRINDGLVVPMLRSARAIFGQRDGRNALLALWGLFAIGLAVNQWMMPREATYGFFLALIIGLSAGGLHPHPYRTLGVIPFASIGLAVCAVWTVTSGDWYSPAVGMAGFIGLMFPPLLTIFAINQPDETRGHGGAILHAGWAAITGCFVVYLLLTLADPIASRKMLGNGIMALSLVGLVFAWRVFLRAAIELTTEIVLWPIYRISATGPGLPLLPFKGPLLVVANHTAMFDPLWLAKYLPRPIRPMMTSKFYDLRVMSWLMRKVFRAIRVPNVSARKEAPELLEAIAALDRGECVVIFPEGWLQRKEEIELRRFGRGIWQILSARPQTPILTCWIRGGWGSYFSYKSGLPMKNKRFDFWRRIRIAFLESFVIDPALLATHMKTRLYLMKVVLEARAILGLPPIDPFKVPIHDDEVKEETP